MARRSSYIQQNQTTQQNKRRVSFDLDHNTVHILPSLEQCRQEASKRGREEWERKQFNQDMLCELIISEIQEQYFSGQEDEEEPLSLKSCLKKIVINEADFSFVHNKKKSKKSNGKKKSKRGHASNKHHAASGCTMTQAYPMTATTIPLPTSLPAY
ncbi:hypothetical protein BDC45DRAFT_523846 [Circinella umbellata]|nr:hypothetical protein BDC45DRAFT_523846 [Circinella umbellata]